MKTRGNADNEKRSQLNRLVFLFVVITVIALGHNYIMISGIVSSLSNREDYRTKPLDPPSSVISAGSNDIGLFIAATALLFLFRTVNPPKRTGGRF